MKKAFFLFGFVICTIVGLAQADVTSAYNANKNGDYESAVQYIEKAMTNEKAISKEKTWRYRGTIYINVAQSPELFAKYPNALSLSSESFKKALSMDDSYAEENKRGLLQVQALAMNAGMKQYETEDYTGAASNFTLSKEISADPFGVVDTMAIFNTALCYEKAGAIDQAIIGYQECAEIGYQVPKVYQYIVNLQRSSGREEDAMKTLQDARAMYPDNQELIIEELNIYLIGGDFEKAQVNLQKAADLDPDNEILFFSLGSVYDNLGKYEEAEGAYLRALEIKQEYFDANYNLGALYFNKAVEMVNDANSIPPNQIKQYNAAMAEANAVFAKATPYLEKAHELNPTDESTLRSLKDIYIRTGNDDKYMEIKDKLEALKG